MSELRSRTIRLAYTNPAVRPYLVELLTSDLSTDRVAMEFPTQEALDEYLKDHPNADKSKHNVKGEGDADDAADDAKKKRAPKKTLLNKLREHVEHILFDDFEDAWSESKAAYKEIVSALKKSKVMDRRAIVESLESANTATKTFFSNRRYRRNKMAAMGRSIKKGGKALANRVWHAIKAEGHEVYEGAKALGQVLTPGSKPLDKKQKKALYSLGAYCAGAAVAAAGGGAVMAAAAVGKSFSLHVGIKAVSHLADAFAVHAEWGKEISHAYHVLPHWIGHTAWEVMSRVAADKDDKSDDKVYEGLIHGMVLAVSKTLEDGMDDDAVMSMLEGKDDDAYEKSADIPAIDKLKSKADKSVKGKSKSDKSKSDKSDKEAALRGRVIRLAHARPDLRPQLLPILVG